jgi:hypothetical protein
VSIYASRQQLGRQLVVEAAMLPSDLHAATAALYPPAF